jgi:two-component system, OmpR family, phosphate regulon response regulator PhoB
VARILVVEDEPDLRELLQTALTSAGHQAFVAGTGREGLRLLREQHPDLVVLDLMLPDMDGTDVCRVLRSEPDVARTAVFVVSAKSDLLDRIEAFQHGADDYLMKPFSFRELLLRVQALLRRSHVLPVPSPSEDRPRR